MMQQSLKWLSDTVFIYEVSDIRLRPVLDFDLDAQSLVLVKCVIASAMALIFYFLWQYYLWFLAEYNKPDGPVPSLALALYLAELAVLYNIC